MKKTLLFSAVVLVLAACSNLNPVKEEGPIDASKIVFNIQVKNADATKGVKTAWENGDVVYAFFQDNTSQYVKMTYNGTSWAYTDKDGGTTFSHLTLTASGKKVSAVYMPNFVCSAAPTYATDKWTFGSINGYFQKAESVDYTVTSTDDVTTLNATLSLTAPANMSQIFIPSTEYSAPASGNEHVLTATHIIPFTFSGIAPGGDATYGTGTNGFPLTPYSGTIGTEEGYYFWGILEGAGTYDFTFQLVERKADKKYAISSKSKSVTGKTVGSSFAAKLTDLTDNGNFVSLGYTGGPLWATGNLDKTNSTIVDPLEAGEYFRYGKTTPYSSTESDYTGKEEPLSTSADVAYSVNTSWRIPTKAQFDALIDASNTNAKEHSNVWKTGWTNIGTDKGGRLITSKVNGISLFFAAGDYSYGSNIGAGVLGKYWSSTPSATLGAYSLYFDSGVIYAFDSYLNDECSVRPVKN
jgi:hypothetical protein